MKQQIYLMAKEVRETRDSKEAARLLQSGDWVAVNAAYQGDEFLWVLIRVQDQSTEVRVLADTLGLLQPGC